MTDAAIEPTEVRYLFDPLCGWCYGASPTIRRLAATAGIGLRLQPTGLFSGEGARAMDEGFAAYAWSNDQRIEKLTGQRFSTAYRDKVLAAGGRFDSGPATLALTAVARQVPGRETEALGAIQAARYVGGRDITDFAELAAILRETNLGAAAEDLEARSAELVEADRARTREGYRMLHALGGNGVPALVVERRGSRRLVGANALFGDFEALVTAIAA